MGSRDPKGYYAILGVGISADTVAIKAAYRRRVMELHPDRNASADATSQIQRLNEAYAVLSVPAVRAEYDTMTVDATQEAAASTPAEPTPIVCSCCGKVSAQPRYVIFLEAKSFFIVTKRSVIQGIFCSTCAEKKALKASVITWLLGWWGIPWGPVYSVHALWTNMLGGERPALANARLVAHQAWYFAATGHPEMARAIALDAMSLAQKIPRPSKAVRDKIALGYDLQDDGAKLRAQIQALLNSVSGNAGMRLKNAWNIMGRPFFAQAAVAATVVAGISLIIANVQEGSYTPPRGPKPYITGSAPQDAPSELQTTIPAQNAVVRPPWVRPATTPDGQPWPAFAAYVSGFPIVNSGGLSSVKVDNRQNNSDVFVKLVSLDGEFARPVRAFFIPAYGQFAVENVTAGTYDVRYENLDTGLLTRSEQFMLQEIKSDDGTQYSTITLTLYKVVNGNMRTYSLARDEF